RDWLKHCKTWEAKLMKLKAPERDTALISLAWSVARVAKKPKPKPVPPVRVRPKRPVRPGGKLIPPKKPAVPGKPGAKPGKPGKPAVPVTPKKPEVPGTPAVPGAPVKPKTPAKPVPPKVTPKTPVKKPVKYDPVYKMTLPSLEMVINWLDTKKMSIKTKRKIARALQHAFGTDEAPTDSQAWMPRLKGKNSVVKGSTVVRGASFMSIDADGDRLLFLVDASDSMLKPLTEAERKAFRRLFPPSEKKSVERNWRGVKTRFDAAKVNLIATLKKLDRKQFFAIIWFGDNAKNCPATPGFLKASKKNVRNTLNSLVRFRPSKATTLKPLGTLLGQTNYYQGFHQAFMHSVRGRVKTDHPEVHKGLIRYGADMIFLLSDGVPNKDGFTGESPAYEYERSVYKSVKTGSEMVDQSYTDPETGVTVKLPAVRMATYKSVFVGKVKEKRKTPYGKGPYVEDAELLLELNRLNLVRKVTVHTIALGETRKTLLQEIAKKGYGKFVEVTK
ncbi:MAG: hypothetical protein P1V97_29130, partial [Planctomycetota bacterium]|nr:hypothetical protein [Planctomycetota bacterium]